MADSSLDDFFAKKDRSKRNKAKIKSSAPDSITKKTDENSKRMEFSNRESKEKSNQSSFTPSSNSSNLSEQDDEWKDVEDEKEIDYSGLRIQALSINEKEKVDQLKEQLIDENKDAFILSESQSGPWKTVSAPSSTIIEEKIEIETPPEKEDTNDLKPKAYVPPALRTTMATSSPGNNATSRKYGKKFAPEISSEVHFPSLLSAAESGAKGYSDIDQSFQSVKHGIKSKNETQHDSGLHLKNKFSALHNKE